MSRQDLKNPPARPGEAEPDAAYASWRRSVEKALGGDSFADALKARLPGGLELEPLYTAESLPEGFDPQALPGQPPYVRGPSIDAGWRIAQEIAHPWTVQAAEAMRADQDCGVRLLWLRLGGIVSPGVWELETATDYSGVCVIGVDDVEKLVAAVEPGVEVVLESGAQALATAAMWVAAARRRGLGPGDLAGSFGCDPLAAASAGGGGLETSFRQLAELAAWTAAEAPAMRSVLVSTSAYHDAGADAVQELAFAIATGVCYLRRMTAGGLDLDAAAAQLDFSFSVGRDVFLEIAKLRAARLLWSKVVAAAGGPASAQAMRIHARTSALETSRIGPWMNLVRGAAQSFAAALGGAGSIRTAPWDEALGGPDDRGRRLATNVQHILAEEARLDRVIDAAGGSWYLESITDQLARRAWEMFRQLEGEGGMARSMERGLVAERLRAAAGERRRAAATRSAPIVGASAFADLAEEPYAPKLPERVELPRPPLHDLAEESGSISIQELLDLEDIKLEREIGEIQQIDGMLVALELSMEAPGEAGELMDLAIDAAAGGARGEQLLEALGEGGEEDVAGGPPKPAGGELERFRLAQPFEQLRAASERWRSSRGRRPRILLLGLVGDDAGRRAPDVAFIRRLFAVAGVESIESAGHRVTDAAQSFTESGTEAAVILAPDALHAEVAELAARLEQLGAGAVFVAGRAGEHEAALRDAGVAGFVYDGCDVQALLAILHEKLKRLPYSTARQAPMPPRGERWTV